MIFLVLEKFVWYSSLEIIGLIECLISLRHLARLK